MNLPDLFFAYIGPETVLPLTSGLAAVVGLLLIFWRFLVGRVVAAWRFVTGRTPAALPTAENPPAAPSSVPAE